jgi:hypothetical protein
VWHVYTDVVAQYLDPLWEFAVDGSTKLSLSSVPLIGHSEGNMGCSVVDDSERGHPKVIT